jgi:ADP-heptose:LPS heptosyltransferase
MKKSRRHATAPLRKSVIGRTIAAMSGKPFPILCILPARPTQAILASGLLARLCQEIPNARFTLVTGPRAAPLFRDMPALDRTLMFEGDGFAAWFSLWRKLRGRRWGLILDLAGTPLPRRLSARKRAVRPKGGEPEHLTTAAARLLKLEADPPAPHLSTSLDTEALADRLLGGATGPILALGPGGDWTGKRWPAERYAFAVTQLTGPRGAMPDATLLLLGGPGDVKLADPIRKALPRSRVIDLIGQTDLLLAYACLKRARLYIGNATALSHLAAASGCPTLALYGPTDDEIESPVGSCARVLRGPRSFEEVKRSDPQLNQPVCHMFDISVEAVARAASRLLAETERATEAAHGRDL